MQKTPLLQAVTNYYCLIFKSFILHCRRSRGSSRRNFKKMYGKIALSIQNSRIFSALHFTVTTVTNCTAFFITIISIIQLLNVTVRKKQPKKGLTVTNCYSLLQTVTSLLHATVTSYNYYINQLTIQVKRNL